MEESTLLLKLQYITDTVKEIKDKMKDFENVNLNFKDLEYANRQQNERLDRAEAAIKDGYESRKRIYARIEVLEQTPQKEKAAMVNNALKYAGVAVLGGALAFVLSKLGALFQ
jgi:septal ring factor EnvC (AmiA/AmiB activator)